jgi:hypothetical protein
MGEGPGEIAAGVGEYTNGLRAARAVQGGVGAKRGKKLRASDEGLLPGVVGAAGRGSAPAYTQSFLPDRGTL